MNIVAIIQARMGSSRLPGKVLMKVKEKSVLEHVIDRVRECKEIDDIVVATTNLQKDDVIIDLLKNLRVNYFRGSEDNVLERYYEAATVYVATDIVRITSDCPLIDPQIVDNIIRFYKNNEYDMVTNAPNDESKRTYPRGLDTEVFSYEILERAYLKGTKSYQREHVTPYIYENDFKIYNYKNQVNYSEYRWTLDTLEDFKLISLIYNNLYGKNKTFYMEDILDYIEKNPQAIDINKDIKQKKIKVELKKLTLRKVTKEDCETLFIWANEEETRKNSFKKEDIDINTHIKWFNEKLEDINTEMYIILKDNLEVGQIRVEIKDHVGIISFSIDKKYRNMGIGKQILKTIKQYSQCNTFIGRVKKENMASIKAFKNAGYRQIESTEYIEFIYGEKSI